MIDIFKYSKYNQYLRDVFTSSMPRGSKTRLANKIGSRSAFISHVLKAEANFTLEQAILCSEFLQHSDDERKFFLLMVQAERAGHHKLTAHFKLQMDELVEERNEISKRIRSKKSDLTVRDQEIYYSSWIYSALHVLSSIEGKQSIADFSKKLKLDEPVIKEACHNLIEMGILQESNGVFMVGKKRMHLSRGSSLISQHHTNWRLESIKKLEWPDRNNLHYSLITAISMESGQKIKDIIMQSIEKSEKIISSSPEEAAFCMNIDFFSL